MLRLADRSRVRPKQRLEMESAMFSDSKFPQGAAAHRRGDVAVAARFRAGASPRSRPQGAKPDCPGCGCLTGRHMAAGRLFAQVTFRDCLMKVAKPV